MQFQNIDPAIDRFVNQRCFFYLQQVREQLNLAEINNENANLIIDSTNSLLFNVGNRTVFKINQLGHVYVNELILDEDDLRTILDDYNVKINDVIQKLIYIMSSEQFVTINNNLKLMGAIINNNNDQFQLPIIDPNDESDNIIALTKNLPDMSDVSYKSINETITGDKIFTGNVKFSGTITNNSNHLVTLPDKDGTLATLDDIPEPLDTEPFVTKSDDQTISGQKTFQSTIIVPSISYDGAKILNVPNTDSTIATTYDLGSYVTLGTVQDISAQKTFTVAPKISTNSLKSSSNYTVTIPNNTCTLMTIDTAQNVTKQKTFITPPQFNNNGFYNSYGYLISFPNLAQSATLATINRDQTISGINTFSKTIKLTDGIQHSSGSKISVPTTSGTMALTSDIPSVSGMVTTTGTQTLINKTLTSPIINNPTISYPSFNNITSTTTYYNSTYLESAGKRYDMGKLHIYYNGTRHPANRSGEASYKNWFDLGIAPNQKVPIFIQSETWHSTKGMFAYATEAKGHGYVWDEIGVTKNQWVFIFAIWVDVD